MNIRHASFFRAAMAATILAALSGSGAAWALAPAAPAIPTAAAQQGTTATDIRDIRGPRTVPSAWMWAAWLAGGALLAAGAYAGWRRWCYRSKPALSPYELALARLEDARALMRPETVREFSIEVSAIVRRYLEDRFQVMATHRTTEEFLSDLVDPANASLESHRDLLAAFLQHCDLAKFAGWSLSTLGMEEMYRSASRFVFATGNPGVAHVAQQSTPASADKESDVLLPTT